MKFAEQFPDAGIVATLSQQLSLSYFVELIKLDDPLQREFYTELCQLERWSVRTLQAKVRGMLFERTALSRKPEALARQELEALRDGDRVTPDLSDIFCHRLRRKDPWVCTTGVVNTLQCDARITRSISNQKI